MSSDAFASVLISFASGTTYGLTSVFVGQPFDTVKTTMQAVKTKESTLGTAQRIVQQHGLRGLYKGGIPPMIGGSIIRSAQFGAYNSSLTLLRQSRLPQKVVCTVDYQVVLAGMAGGVGRAVVEAPMDYIKTRQQMSLPWTFKQAFTGTSATFMRNIWLFAVFAYTVDLSKQLTKDGKGLSPFWTGAVCATTAWLAVWPLDVVKSRIQSGMHEKRSVFGHLVQAARSGALYRGLAPGLLRASIANGCAMYIYKRSSAWAEEMMGITNKDGSAI